MSQMDTLESLADEFLHQYREGKEPKIEDYARQHPQWEREIQELFPAALMMEKIKRRKQLEQASIKSGGIPWGDQLIESLGEFRIVRELGRGGMGIVYEAVQESLGRRVAVKVLKGPTLDSTQAQRFYREARAAARLHHTNIVPVFGIGEHQGLHYYVMQKIDGVGVDLVLFELNRLHHSGTTLRIDRTVGTGVQTTCAFSPSSVAYALMGSSARWKSAERSESPPAGGRDACNTHANMNSPANNPIETSPCPAPVPLNWQMIADIGHQVAQALQHAHSQNVLHRDIKPGNLILDGNGVVWIADFGLAKFAEQDSVTRTGDVVGTLRYMAPEQLEGGSDARSDVYSLGLTLYELVTARPAFEQTDRAQLVQQILHGEMARPRKFNPTIPRDLETIILTATARDPSDRYATAQDLANDLLAFQEDRPILARRMSVMERFFRWCRRNPAIALPSLATAVLLVAILGILAHSSYRMSAAMRDLTHQTRQANVHRHRAEENAWLAWQGLEAAERHRDRAEANLALSLEAFEEVFNRIAPRPSPADLVTDEEAQLEAVATTAVTRREAMLLQSLMQFYERFTQENDDNIQLRRQAALAYRRVGDIHARLGQFEQAEQAYTRCLDLFAKLEQPGTEEKISLATVHNDLGVMLTMSGRFELAQTHHQQAQRILCQETDQTVRNEKADVELVRTYHFLGNAMNQSCEKADQETVAQRRAAAVEHHRKALSFVKQLGQRNPLNPDYQLLMAQSYRDLASVIRYQSGDQEIVQANQQAIEILEQLTSVYPTVPNYQYELMKTYISSSCSLARVQGEQVVEDSYRQALRVGQRLVKQLPAVPEYARRCASVHLRLANWLKQRGRHDEAVGNLEQAIALMQTQVDLYPEVPQNEYFLAYTQDCLAEFLFDRQQYDESRALVERIVVSIEPISDRMEGDWKKPFRSLVRRQYQRLERLAAAMEVVETATELSETSAEISETATQ